MDTILGLPVRRVPSAGVGPAWTFGECRWLPKTVTDEWGNEVELLGVAVPKGVPLFGLTAAQVTVFVGAVVAANPSLDCAKL